MVPYVLLYLMVGVYFGSLWKIFEKNGRKSWEGFIPIYNIFIWLKIIKKPWWWIFFFIVPFVNLIVAIGCNVETARLFGRYSVKDTLLMVLLPWYYMPYLAYTKNLTVVEPTDWTKKSDRDKRFWHDQLTLFFIAPFVGHALYIVFRILGSRDKANKKTMACEWTNALGFAIVAASIIRSFFFEAFTIPTGSMEKTMRIGDYLFVNKMKYGPKLPQTPISIPFVHNRIPGTFIPSFTDWFSTEYSRLPGYGEIKRGNIMVFNWPVGDTVILDPGVVAHDYYAILRNEAYFNCAMDLKAFKIVNPNAPHPFDKESTLSYDQYQKYESKYMNAARNKILNGGSIAISPVGYLSETDGITTLPVDKKENYIKRCVAVGGDTLEIINNKIFINGKSETYPEESIFNHRFYANYKKAMLFPNQPLFEDYEIYYKTDISQHRNFVMQSQVAYIDSIYNTDSSEVTLDTTLNMERSIVEYITCSNQTKEQLKLKYPGWDSIVTENEPKGYQYEKNFHYCPIFPNHPGFNWSRDNFGPLYIPAAGGTITLNEKNWIIYRRAIEVYEQNEVSVNENGQYLINGQIADSYTFKQNYYWLMGDNRHGSADSRYWGFVPEDHVVGTASFVWFSKNQETGIRWNRIFSTVE